ncbi:cytoskeleton protein RodZ [Vibrio sp. S4M6]|uniref:cytoskeleton protein RodZ n=1 Tax=Vibrio sinus TaxID=2946865 RepID=UPI00202A3B11|nr:cytoskeleton protein RodZ [Vibrio sinus]MCL9783946.1 cytoskeleton protein RodZ [Vibrio sinus]
MSTKQNVLVEEEIVETVELEAGTILKNKREELGLSQKQIADRLRLKLSIIQDIENNNFEIGQVATFTRGYLRSYAKAVGIEESAILAALGDEDSAKPQAQTMTSFSRKTKNEKHDNRIMIITWAILAVIIGISSLWWWQNQQRDTLLSPSNGSQSQAPAVTQNPTENAPQSGQAASDSNKTDFTTLKAGKLTSQDEKTPATQTQSSTQNPVNEPSKAPTSTSEGSQSATTASSAPASTTTHSTEKTVEPEQGSSAVSPQSTNSSSSSAASAEKTIDMSFKDDCWLQIKDATGKVLVSGIKKGGQTLKLSGEAPFNVILGAPENVSMTIASEPVDLSRYTPGKVARFTLP